MDSIGFGIIGLGRIGGFHANSLRHAISGAHLVAAAVDDDHRCALLESGDAPCPLEPDVETLLARGDVAAIVVASPAVAHDEHIALAARAGKPIFSEKPLADSVPKAEAAAQAVLAAGVPFQIGFQRRYDRGYARARELIAAGSIGAVEMFRGMSCDRLGPIDFLRTSGGIFMDLASHDFDAARFLTGEEISEVLTVNAIGQTKQGAVIVSFRNSENQLLETSVAGDLDGALPLLRKSFNVTADVVSVESTIVLTDVVLVAGK